MRQIKNVYFIEVHLFPTSTLWLQMKWEVLKYFFFFTYSHHLWTFFMWFAIYSSVSKYFPQAKSQETFIMQLLALCSLKNFLVKASKSHLSHLRFMVCVWDFLIWTFNSLFFSKLSVQYSQKCRSRQLLAVCLLNYFLLFVS